MWFIVLVLPPSPLHAFEQAIELSWLHYSYVLEDNSALLCAKAQAYHVLQFALFQ